MTSKHTPGPWRNIKSMPSEGFDGWWLKSNGTDVATISGYQNDPEAAANARLIAAAPDLLDALRAIITDPAYAESEDGETGEPCELIAAGRAAIAKAEAALDAELSRPMTAMDALRIAISLGTNPEADDVLGTLDELDRANEINAFLIDAMVTAADWFREYEAIHIAKGGAADAKAARNRERAETIEDAIAKAEGTDHAT